MIIAILLSFLLFIVSGFSIYKSKFTKILYSISLLVLFFATGIYLWSNHYTGNGIDESVIYQVKYGFEGAGIVSEKKIIIIVFSLFLIGIISSFIIYNYFHIYHNKNRRKIFAFFSYLFLISAFSVHPLTYNLIELSGFLNKKPILFTMNVGMNASGTVNNSYEEPLFANYYKIPPVHTENTNNKNIIFIYLESFEKMYLDENTFPGLTKNLNELKKESIFFDNINTAYGATWTIASMVGGQCGIPLVTSGGGENSMHGIDAFLPGAYCIGDFLKNNGYNLNYIGGALLDFAGKGNFYGTHGFENVEGLKELRGKYPGLQKYDWGLYDQDMYEFAYKKYDELAKKDEKFGLFLLTMDTHGEQGVISQKCRDNNYYRYSEDDDSVLNSYYCGDFLVNDFVKKIRNNPNFKNTTIVIASDHLAMSNNNSTSTLKKKEDERRILFLILDPEQKEQKIVSHTGSTFDIGATVLGNLGFQVDNFGLGVNLLNDKNVSILGKNPYFDFEIWEDDYQKFWSYPKMKNGIGFDGENKKMILGNQKIIFPALIVFDDTQEIKKIQWSEQKNKPVLITHENKTEDFILIDFCKYIDENISDTYCVEYSKKNGTKKVFPLQKNQFISKEEIKNFFTY